MIVIGDRICNIGNLRLQPWLRPLQEALADIAQFTRILFGTMLEDALTCLEHQVEAGEVRILGFQLVDNAQRLQIVLETAVIPHARVQGILPGVPERRVPQVVGKTDRLDQSFVQLQRDRNGTGYLRDLERMRQASTVQIAFMVDEHLGLVNEPAECRRVNDAVTVALVLAAVPRSRLFEAPALRPRLIRSVRRERRSLHQVATARMRSSNALS